MKIFFLLFAMVLIASFPFLSDFFGNGYKGSKGNVEKVVEEYILNNPQKILESVQKWEMEESNKNAKERFSKIFEENKSHIVDFSYPHIKGKDEDSVVIVEFFDYSCGYCKRMKDILHSVIESGNATIIFRDFPILGDASMLASKFAIAVNIVDSSSYQNFHLALLGSSDAYTRSSLVSLLKKVLSDDSKVEKVVHLVDHNSQEIDNMINATYELTNKIGIRGTPAFLIGDELRVGFLYEKDLESLKILKGSSGK